MIILVIAIIIRIIANPISNVFQKQLTNKHHPLFVNLVSYGLLSLVSIFLISDFPFNKMPNAFWYYSLIGGLFGALGNGFIIKALQKGELSVLGPINAYKSIIGILFAFLLIGELPNTWGFLGVGLIIIGSYFVLDNGNEQFTWAVFKQPAIQYRIAALVFTGIQAVTDKQVILHSNLTYAFAGWCIFGFLFSIPLFFTSRINIRQQVAMFSRSITFTYIALSFSVGTMVLCTNYAFKNMQVGTALALFQISILLTVIFGHHFFNEKGILKKITGAMIMIIGSLLIILLK
jgi:drug/metabolite transporter (DMT)-like permease